MRQKGNPKQNMKNQRPRKRTNNNKGTQNDCKANELIKTDHDNDASWYFNVPEVADSAAAVSFANPIGYPIMDLDSVGSTTRFPGIMTFNTIPVIGECSDSSAPINRATRLLYDKVNYKNARNRSYDPADLMIVQYCIASAYMWHAHLKRLYGILNTSSYINAYIPEGLISALGFSDEIRWQKDELYFHLNTFALAINKYAVPLGMPFFERSCWLFSNVFMDTANAKAGLYAFKPSVLYEYNETGSELGGTADPFSLNPAVKMDMSDIKTISTSILDHLQGSQDLNFMSADVMQAYDNNVLQIASTPIDYTVVPVYAPEVLNQIHNIKTVLPKVGNQSLVIKQESDGLIKQAITIAKGWVSTPGQQLLDLINDNPTPGDVMVATRLMPVVDSKGQIVSSGTEIISSIDVYTLGKDNSTYYNYVDAKNYQEIINAVNACANISKFNMAPMFKLHWQDPDLSSNYINGYLSDVYNYTTVSGPDLRNMHMAALLSEFSVPFGNK